MAGALSRLGGNIALYKELLSELGDSLDGALSALRTLIQDGKNKEALIRLHGLKGVSGNLGAVSLNQASQNLEQALATSRQKQYETLITRLEQAIRVNLATINTFLAAEAPPSSDPPPPDTTSEDILTETLHLLDRLLKDGRLDAVDIFARLKRLMRHRPPHSEFNKLTEAMGRLDYANALEALTALAASLNIVL